MHKRDDLVNKIAPFVDRPVIKLITGMRRTGKSTLMRLMVQHLVARGVDESRILLVNMESIDVRHLQDSMVFHQYVREKKNAAGGKVYLFIDEVQEIHGWEKLVSSFLADDDADIYVTGSNSQLLSGEYATLLSGRYVSFHVMPLVYSEYLVFRGEEEGSPDLFNEFITLGGMPGIHHIEYEREYIYQYLAGIKDTVILKDIVARYNIRDVPLLEKLVLFLSNNIGNTFSARSIAAYFKKEQRSLGIETIYNYLSYLETAFVFSRVPRLDIKGKRLLETNEKYYITDLGLRHSFSGFRQEGINAYLENIVFIELIKRGYRVMIGSVESQEIDFIAENNSGRLYIQVAYLLSDEKTVEREYRSLMAIKDNYPKIVLSMDALPESNRDGIFRMYLPDFLLQRV